MTAGALSAEDHHLSCSNWKHVCAICVLLPPGMACDTERIRCSDRDDAGGGNETGTCDQLVSINPNSRLADVGREYTTRQTAPKSNAISLLASASRTGLRRHPWEKRRFILTERSLSHFGLARGFSSLVETHAILNEARVLFSDVAARFAQIRKFLPKALVTIGQHVHFRVEELWVLLVANPAPVFPADFLAHLRAAPLRKFAVEDLSLIHI